MILNQTPGSAVSLHEDKYLYFPDTNNQKFGPTFGVTLRFDKEIPMDFCRSNQTQINATISRNDVSYNTLNDTNCTVYN